MGVRDLGHRTNGHRKGIGDRSLLGFRFCEDLSVDAQLEVSTRQSAFRCYRDRRCPERNIRSEALDTFVFDQIRAALLRPDTLLAGEQAVASRTPTPDDELLNVELAHLDRKLTAATMNGAGAPTYTKLGWSHYRNCSIGLPTSSTVVATSPTAETTSRPSVGNSPATTNCATASPASPSASSP